MSTQKPDGVIEIEEGINIDVSSDGNIVGIEFIDAAKKMPLDSFLKYKIDGESIGQMAMMQRNKNNLSSSFELRATNYQLRAISYELSTMSYEPRTICIVTGTRAEYGLLYWLMKEIQSQIMVKGKLKIRVPNPHKSGDINHFIWLVLHHTGLFEANIYKYVLAR